MTKYLILVKHSLPEIQADQPANTWKLSLQGRLRAERLAEHLIEFQPEILVSSDEPKARETAEILARRLRMQVQLRPDLREHDRSEEPFLTAEAFQAAVREFFLRPAELVFGQETADQAHARFYRAVHRIMDQHRNKTVLIVTHGTVIALFVSRLTGAQALPLWHQLGLPSFVVMDLSSSTVIVRNHIV